MKNDMVIVTVCYPPFGGTSEPELFPPGCSIADTRPKDAGAGLLVVQINGGPEYVPAECHADTTLEAGTLVEWSLYPRGEGRGGLAQALLAIVSIVANVYAPGSGAYVYAFGSIVTSLYAANRAGRDRGDDGAASSNTYSVSVQGNAARLYQVIPKICGRHQSYPAFAGEPYTEFRAVTRDGRVDHDQYFYAVYCLGVGNHDIEKVLIDDTDLGHFNDIIVRQYLPPGTLPTVASPCVVTAPEVAGQELLTSYYVGGYSACGPRSIATHISVDVQAPRGLYISDAAGTTFALNVKWDVEIRQLNEFGTAISTWQTIAHETRTEVSTEPRRWTVEYALETPSRVEVRVVRTDLKSDSAQAVHDLVWSALRARLQVTAPLNPHAAHFELVMRASKQLNSISQSRLSIIATGKCRTWSPESEWSEEVATRNPAWWLADLWTSPIWGEGLDDSAIDLEKLYELAQVWDRRQDRFDHVFDTSMDAESAAQLIAGTGRARCFRRGGVRTLARDEALSLPRTAFHRRNTKPGSMQTTEALPGPERPDGVIVEYFDNRSWSWGLPIPCPAPGVTSMTNPVRVRLSGITGRTHATREGLYTAAKLALRRETVTCVTEMQGILPAFFEAVRWQPDTGVLGQCGDVIEQNDLTLTLSEPPQWGEETLAISLQRDDGSYTPPMIVSAGADDHDVVLADQPDFQLITDDGDRERPKYVLFKLVDSDESLVKISLIEDGGEDESGAQLLKLTAFIDDDRIHQVDVHLLPSPGEDQDAIDTTPETPGGGQKAIVNLPASGDYFTLPVGPWWPSLERWTFRTDGVLNYRQENILYPGSVADNNFADCWLIASPLETIHSSRYEVRATITALNVVGVADYFGTYGVWLPLSEEQQFGASVINHGPSPALEDRGRIDMNVFFEVREIATGIIQESVERQFVVYNFEESDGGGS